MTSQPPPNETNNATGLSPVPNVTELLLGLSKDEDDNDDDDNDDDDDGNKCVGKSHNVE